MSVPSANRDAPPRVAALVARFREIGATRMADLPIYHHALEVEAVGFQLRGDDWIGVLITPWFMNVLVLPAEPRPMDVAAIGRRHDVELPSGSQPFMVGGDEVIGAYHSLSLHSPVMEFDQAAARAEATRRLATLLTPPEPEQPDDMPHTDEAQRSARRTTVYRRDLLRGRGRA